MSRQRAIFLVASTLADHNGSLYLIYGGPTLYTWNIDTRSGDGGVSRDHIEILINEHNRIGDDERRNR